MGEISVIASQSNNSMWKIWLVIIILLLLFGMAIAFYFWFSGGDHTTSEEVGKKLLSNVSLPI